MKTPRLVLLATLVWALSAARSPQDDASQGEAPQDVREELHANGQLASRTKGVERDGTWVRSGAFEAWFPDGETRVQGEYRNDLRAGRWAYFWPNGKRRARGAYRKGLRIGKWLFYDRKGSLEMKGTYTEGRRSEQWSLTSEKQRAHKRRSGEATYSEESHGWMTFEGESTVFRDGAWVMRWPDRTPALWGEYVEGIPVGVWHYQPFGRDELGEGEPRAIDTGRPAWDPDVERARRRIGALDPRPLDVARLGTYVFGHPNRGDVLRCMAWLDGEEAPDWEAYPGSVDVLLGHVLLSSGEDRAPQHPTSVRLGDAELPTRDLLDRYLLAALARKSPKLRTTLKNLGPAAYELWCTPAEARKLRDDPPEPAHEKTQRSSTRGSSWRSTRTGGGKYAVVGIGGTSRKPVGMQATLLSALDWLAQSQSENGTWNEDPTFVAGTTSLCLLAYLGVGELPSKGHYPEVTDRSLQALLRLQDSNTGRIATQSGELGDWEHALATTALAETYFFLPSLELAIGVASASEHLDAIASQRSRWDANTQASLASGAIGSAAAVLAEIGFPVGKDSTEKIAEWARARPLGSEGMLAIRAYVAQFLLPEGFEASAEELAVLLDPELARPSGSTTAVFLNHYRTYVAYQQGRTLWKQWDRAISAHVMETWEAEGRYAGSWPPPEDNLGGRALHTAIMTLNLEVHLRYGRRVLR